MNRILSILCVVAWLLSMVALIGCSEPAEDEKAKQIRQSGLDIFDPALYQSGLKAETITASEVLGAGFIHCRFGIMNDSFSNPVLYDLMGQAGIFIWNDAADDQSLSAIYMPDFEPNGRQLGIFSKDTDLYHNVFEVLFCTGVPNIGDYLFYQRPELTRIYLPDSVTEIGDHAFADNCQTTIYCHRGSYAEQYAKKHNISYQLI